MREFPQGDYLYDLFHLIDEGQYQQMQLQDRDTINGYKALVFALAIVMQTVFITTGDLQSYASYLGFPPF